MKQIPVTYADKLLPNQPEFSNLYRGKAPVEAEILDTIRLCLHPERNRSPWEGRRCPQHVEGGWVRVEG